MTIEPLSFDEFVDLVRERMFDADALFTSRVHSFQEDLLPDYVGVVPDNWWEDALQELCAQGHIGIDASTFGGQAARLSADGKFFVRQARAD